MLKWKQFFDKWLEGEKVPYTTLAPFIEQQLSENVSEEEIIEIVVNVMGSMIYKSKEYDYWACLLCKRYHESKTQRSFVETCDLLQKNKDIRGCIRPLLHEEFYAFIKKNAGKVESVYETACNTKELKPSTLFGWKTLYRSYLMKTDKGVVERPDHLWFRVALFLHRDHWEHVLETFQSMRRGEYIHATPTLFNAGMIRPQMASCFLVGTEDSVGGIFKTVADVAQISKWAGGIGVHITNIRGNQAYIYGTNGYSNGIMPMLKIYNDTGRYIDQCFGGKTRIFTENGLVPIANMKKGIKVLTHKGTYEEVEKVLKYTLKDQEIWTCESELFPGEKVEVTPGHSFYVGNTQKSNRWKEGIECVEDDGRLEYQNILNDEWKELSEFDENDRLRYELPPVTNTGFWTIEKCYWLGLTFNSMRKIDEDTYMIRKPIEEAMTEWEIGWNSVISYVPKSEEEWIQIKTTKKTIITCLVLNPKYVSHLIHSPREYMVSFWKGWMCNRFFGEKDLPYQDALDTIAFCLRNRKHSPLGKKITSTIVPEMDVYDLEVSNHETYQTTLGLVHNGGGKRKGAFAMYIEPWHSDILEFLRAKRSTGSDEERARDLFYGLWIPDLFMEKVEKAEDWYLMCPSQCPSLSECHGEQFNQLYQSYINQKRYVSKIPARELWEEILRSQIETGLPYMLYKDSCNRKSNQQNLGTIRSSNLCVPAETKVCTRNGWIPIGTLKDVNTEVWNGQKFSSVTIEEKGKTCDFLLIGTDNGCEMKCTPEHTFYILNEENKIEIRRAQELAISDQLLSWKLSCPTVSIDLYRRKQGATYACMYWCRRNESLASYMTFSLQTWSRIQYRIEPVKYHIMDASDDPCHEGYVQCYFDPQLYFDGRSILPINTDISFLIGWMEMSFMMMEESCFTKSVSKNRIKVSNPSICQKGNGHYWSLDLEMPKHFSFPMMDIVLIGQRLGIRVEWKCPTILICMEDWSRWATDDWTPIIREWKEAWIHFKSVASVKKDATIHTKITKIEPMKSYHPQSIYCFEEPDEHRAVFDGILAGNCTEIIEYSDAQEYAVCNLASIALPKCLVPRPLTRQIQLNIITKGNCVYCTWLKNVLDRHDKIKYITQTRDDLSEEWKEHFVKIMTWKQSRNETLTYPIVFDQDWQYIGGWDEVWRQYLCPVFDYEKLANIVKQLVINLNEIIDKNAYPLPETQKSNLRHRPIGIGVQGLADVFCAMRWSYDSMEARECNRLIFETMYFHALQTSNELAIVKTPYESFHGSPLSKGCFHFELCENYDANKILSSRYDWETLRRKIFQFGTRNSLFIAPMPTASTSQILGNTESFEPLTSNMYLRRTLAGEFYVCNTYLQQDLKDMGLWNEECIERIIFHKGSIEKIPEIPTLVKNVYRTVWEIPQKSLIDMAVDRQYFIDQSQSMNIYLYPPSSEKLTKIHFYGWKKGLKTGSYYVRSRAAISSQRFTMDPIREQEIQQEYECQNCSA